MNRQGYMANLDLESQKVEYQPIYHHAEYPQIIIPSPPIDLGLGLEDGVEDGVDSPIFDNSPPRYSIVPRPPPSMLKEMVTMTVCCALGSVSLSGFAILFYEFLKLSGHTF